MKKENIERKVKLIQEIRVKRRKRRVTKKIYI
jgi:hypothetical protein